MKIGPDLEGLRDIDEMAEGLGRTRGVAYAYSDAMDFYQLDDVRMSSKKSASILTFQRFWTLESRLQFHLVASLWSTRDP